jgi:hypothetical protein
MCQQNGDPYFERTFSDEAELYLPRKMVLRMLYRQVPSDKTYVFIALGQEWRTAARVAKFGTD